jgi:hypothetical protein
LEGKKQIDLGRGWLNGIKTDLKEIYELRYSLIWLKKGVSNGRSNEFFLFNLYGVNCSIFYCVLSNLFRIKRVSQFLSISAVRSVIVVHCPSVIVDGSLSSASCFVWIKTSVRQQFIHTSELK